jgi:hypothetical protein
METNRIERRALVQAGKSRGAVSTGGMMAPRQIIGKPAETNNGWRCENLCKNFSISSNSLPGRQIMSMKSCPHEKLYLGLGAMPSGAELVIC